MILDGQIDVARTCSKAPAGVHHHRAQSSLIWKSQIELLASLGWTSEALNLGKEQAKLSTGRVRAADSPIRQEAALQLPQVKQTQDILRQFCDMAT